MDNNEIEYKYKRAFDDIHASRELHDKILGESLKRRRRHYNVKPIIGAVATMAAAVTIFVSVKDYGFNKTDDIITETSVISSTDAPQTDDASETTAPPTETEQSEPVQTPAAENTRKKAVTTAEPTKTAVPVKAASPVKTVPANTVEPIKKALPASSAVALPTQEAEKAVSQIPSPSPETDEQPEYENDLSAASYTVNNADTGAVSSGGGSADSSLSLRAVKSSAPDTQENTSELWENNRYFEYIGASITDRVRRAGSYTYTGGSGVYMVMAEDGTIQNDEAVFSFGANGKSINIITSKIKLIAPEYLSSDGADIRTIAGERVAVKSFDNGFTCYMMHNGTSYVLDCFGLTEQEVQVLITSLVN